MSAKLLLYRGANTVWKLCHRTFSAIRAHTKEVDRTRYCACCGGMALYFTNTAFCDMTPEEMTFPSIGPQETPEKEVVEYLLTAGTPEFYFCTDHHPFIGKKREQSQALLSPFHKKLRFHMITPNPFM